MKGLARRRPALAAATLLCGLWASAAPAYYHYLHFRSGAAGAERRPERFDLAELTDGRLLFYVSRSERPLLAPNDSWEGVLSQIQRALDVWNEVPSAALRVGFGGLVDEQVPGDAPAALIAFAELPPGVLGLGGPTVKGEARDGLVPIRRSQVVLTTDLASGSRGRQSFSELFFSTLTHEIGHALGLQHSLSGSAMSTDPTRSTTRALPLEADDVAGLAALYPPADDRRRVGAITGRVAFASGEPAFLASVAAIHAGGAVVTALTDPDGTYRIEGLAPGEHLVYVQPPPPATQAGLGPANLVLPTFEDGSSAPPVPAFRALFRGGATRPEDSPRVLVRAGAATAGVDFTPRPAAQPDVHTVTTFSFPGNDAPGVHPAFVNLTTDPGMILATGPGLIEQGRGTRITSILRDVSVSPPTPYERDDRFLRLDLAAAPFEGFGPLHLLFQTPEDFYVLPAAVRLTPVAAPVIYWIVQDFAVDGLWRLRGDRLDLQSSVFFDGQPAEIVGFDDFLGELLVRPPPGPSGRRAVVTAFNPDGQSSALTLPDGNVVFEYPPRNAPELTVRTAGGAPGEDVLIEASGGIGFEAGRVDLGVGSSDVVVRAVEVLAPDRIAAVATVRPNASPGAFSITVVNGLDIQVFADAFRVDHALSAASETVPRVPFNGLVHGATGRPELAAGVVATLRGERLALAADVRVTFNGVAARLLSVAPERLELLVPENLRPGAVEMKVFNGVSESGGFPLRLVSAAPGLFAASLPNGQPVGAASPAAVGEAVELLATGVPTRSEALESAVLRILVEGVPAALESVEPTAEPGVQRIRFTIPRSNVLSRAEAAEVAILLDGRLSNALRLPLR